MASPKDKLQVWGNPVTFQRNVEKLLRDIPARYDTGHNRLKGYIPSEQQVDSAEQEVNVVNSRSIRQNKRLTR